MDANKTFSSGKNTAGDTWYVDNYILLKEYYDMTISRIAARCIRKGNIAMEEYEHYPYILDVLEEISETGDYIVVHTNLYEYVDRKIPGGMNTLKKSLQEFKMELQNNASPDMIKQDPNEIKKIKEALGDIAESDDPTRGAGMSMDDVINKLMQENNITSNFEDEEVVNIQQPQAPQPQVQAPRPQVQQPQASQPQAQAPRPQVQQPQAPQPQAQAPRPQVQQPQASQPQAQAPRPQVQQPQVEQPQVQQPQNAQPNS